jgi:FixJ family two-component response regulator
VIILSAHANEEYVIRALRSGAAGYMLKDAATWELELAINAIAQGNTYLSTSISRTVIDSSLEQLTARLREILQLIAEGKNTKEIAGILEISVKIVEAHRATATESAHGPAPTHGPTGHSRCPRTRSLRHQERSGLARNLARLELARQNYHN